MSPNVYFGRKTSYTGLGKCSEVPMTVEASCAHQGVLNTLLDIRNWNSVSVLTSVEYCRCTLTLMPNYPLHISAKRLVLDDIKKSHLYPPPWTNLSIFLFLCLGGRGRCMKEKERQRKRKWKTKSVWVTKSKRDRERDWHKREAEGTTHLIQPLNISSVKKKCLAARQARRHKLLQAEHKTVSWWQQ